MKRDFLLGGDKIADWGGSKGGWGGHVPPSLYVKRGPDNDSAHKSHLMFVNSNTTALIPCLKDKQ